METYLQPNILFLRGVFLDDFILIEDLFFQQLQEKCDNQIIEKKEPENINQENIKMPPIFTTLPEWVKTTPLLCKNCSLRPWRIPVPVPTSMTFCVETRASKIQYNGICCSFVCARSYIDKYVETNARFDAINMLKKIFKEFTGQNITFIPIAPHYAEMDKYVGSTGLTEAEFRKKIDTLEAAIRQQG